jgi:4,5-DOPA dioxygenase extradiol
MASTLFVSHGAPSLPLGPSPAREFLSDLGRQLGRPRAVLAVSAHFEAQVPVIGAQPAPETVHDFYGFPDALYELGYPAPGDPELAAKVAWLLRREGFAAEIDVRRGLDHGAWVPLMLMFPQADVPVVPLSLVRGRGRGAAYHLRLGTALRGLADDGVLVLGSGSMTHNLRELDWAGGPTDGGSLAWVTGFTDWFEARIAAGETEALADYRARAPQAARNHPTEEHLMPFFVALGASAFGRGRRLHASVQMGALAMDAYAFD